MKILLIDKDNESVSTLKSCLEPMGHRLTHEADKNKAVERLSSSEFDIIFLDPVPLSSPRPIVLNIRRGVSNYPYIFLLSETASREEAIRAGSNDIMPKPLEKTMVQDKTVNAERLSKLMKRIGDDSEDFPSAGGVIAKSAFNQLFLSALDRADRYGERTFVLFIGVSNYQDIRDMDGPYAADYAVAKLSKYLVLLRRQSDIIGQTGKHEFALLLQRPVYDTEPLEAANRFAESLAGIKDITSSGSTPVDITVTLIDVPVGSKITEHVVRPGKQEKK